ncbi:MAG: hypothetical protein IKA84_01595 [Clostridia bacterium]|nr:hypothetical protein [Clostridia bacterium]
MAKYIYKIFVIFGIVFILMSLVAFAIQFVMGLIVLVLGGTVLFLGLSMQRLAKIEDKLGKFVLLPKDAQKPLVKCEVCGRLYEIDYGHCPYCEAERVKKAFIR